MSTGTSNAMRAHLSGHTLVIVRITWLTLAVLSLSVYLAAIPPRLDQLSTVCAQAGCARQQLFPEEARLLQQFGLSMSFYAVYIRAIGIITVLGFVAAAGIIFWRKSDDWVAVSLSFTLIMFGTAAFSTATNALVMLQSAWRLPIDFLRAISWAASLLFFFLFPNGQFVPRWTRAPALVWAAWALTWPFLPALNPLQWPLLLSSLALGGWVGIGLLAQTYRYVRVSGSVERQQTKWIVFGVTAAFAGYFVFNLSGSAFPVLRQPGLPRLIYLLIGFSVYRFILLLMPLTVVFSILRYRLFEIDLILTRSLIYSGLTGVLGLIFLGSVTLLEQVFEAITGGQQAPLALAIAALVIGVLFLPTRNLVQAWIDRRFFPAATLSSPARVSRVAPGVRLGQYKVLELIGHGGMAEVYKGRHIYLDRAVAIKILPHHLAAESDFRRRFEQEAHTVAALRHPNIVQVFDFGHVADTYYMVMEYIAGRNLAQYLREVGPMPLAQARPLITDIASALDYAHAHGLVHRDVKPSNVMLQPLESNSSEHTSKGYRTILTDFGLAKLITSSQAVTQTGPMGTLNYVAPERMLGSKHVGHVDGRADVYALGVMLYQMLTGQLPFPGDDPGAVVMAHLQHPPPDPRDLMPDLPREAAQAVRRAMAKSPEERFATAGEFAAALG